MSHCGDILYKPGRSNKIRTCDLYVPNVALYQTELYSANNFVPRLCKLTRQKSTRFLFLPAKTLSKTKEIFKVDTNAFWHKNTFMELYHGTTVQDLSEITPHLDGYLSTPYVFATPNFASALRYATLNKGNNYFGIENDTAIIVESFPGSFEKTYNDVSGVIYVLPCEQFQLTKLHPGKSVTVIEYVSTEPVKPIKTIQIPDVMQKLLRGEELGHIKIYRYPDIPKNFFAFDEGLRQKIQRFLYKKFIQKKR